MKKFSWFLVITGLLAAAVLQVRYGAGVEYPDLSTTPRLEESALEEVLRYPEPIGNVAVNSEGRIFFTVHPESRPRGNKLLEWVDGAAVPYPGGSVQPHLFETILGLVIDRQNRLWTIDHGNHGFGKPRLLAFDLDTGRVTHDHEFQPEIAPAGSFLQDLQVTAEGNKIFIADASIWRQRPAIIAYDIATRSARRLLESHESVTAKKILVRTPTREMKFLGGIVSLRTGVDGIVIDNNDEWLYYGAINHDGLFRVRVRDLLDPDMPPRELESNVERYSNKPLSDGLSTDLEGNIYVTDVEHGSVAIVDTERNLSTIIRSPRVRWADALSFGPEGWLYLADSAIQDQVLMSKEYISSRGPYYVFRFKPGASGISGH